MHGRYLLIHKDEFTLTPCRIKNIIIYRKRHSKLVRSELTARSLYFHSKNAIEVNFILVEKLSIFYPTVSQPGQQSRQEQQSSQ